MASPFDHCAGDYAAARPHYPEALLDALCDFVRSSSTHGNDLARVRAIDLGAGTGIFTRQLARRGIRGVAFDLGMALLAEFVNDMNALPPSARWPAVCAKAEGLPLAEGSVDLVTAAQSFHWFNPKLTFAELGRVLVPAGVLALVWNNRDVGASPFWQAYESLIEQFNPAYEREYREQNWSGKAGQSGNFGPMSVQRFHWVWTLTCEQLLGYARSISYIRNVLSSTDLQRFLADLRRLWHAELRADRGSLPMKTDLYLTHRLT